MKTVLSLFFTIAVIFMSAQQNSCLQELMACHNYNSSFYDSLDQEKTLYMSYTVKVTNWDNESTISNVKTYRRGKETRFFSEQVNMYTNDKEMLVEMPAQRVIAINNALPEPKQKKTNIFQDIRKDFLDSCEVIKCDQTKNTRILVLKVTPKQMEPGIEIVEMRYEFDTEKKLITGVKTSYTSNYKLKTMQVIYRDIDKESAYKFSPFRQQFMDRKGNLTGKYKDYELVDSRDTKKGSSKKK